jgi:hypothetical protein
LNFAVEKKIVLKEKTGKKESRRVAAFWSKKETE